MIDWALYKYFYYYYYYYYCSAYNVSNIGYPSRIPTERFDRCVANVTGWFIRQATVCPENKTSQVDRARFANRGASVIPATTGEKIKL